MVVTSTFYDHLGMPVASPRYANDPALLALGAAIRQARRDRGMSQESLAHRAMLDRAYMSSVERGAQNPGFMAVWRIAQALELTVTELVASAAL